MLAPGSVPIDEVVLDGRVTFGWSTYEAGLLDVATAAGIFESLLARLTVSGDRPLGEHRPPDVLSNERAV